MYNYKGIFYKEEKEKKFYEGGAHFKYSDLVFMLNKLIEKKKIRGENIDNDSLNEKHSLLSNNKNIINEEKKSKSMNTNNKQTKLKINLFSTNNNFINNKNNLNFFKHSKLVLNTEKNNENKQKWGLIETVSKKMKISPLKTNSNYHFKKVFSVDKNNNIKTLNNNNKYKKDNIYKNISLYMNHNKNIKNNLPLIKDFHSNNFSNQNIFKLKQNNLINLNLESKNKNEFSKFNLFLKNKVKSPIKNIKTNRENKVLSVDFSELKKYNNVIGNNLTTSFSKNKNFNKGRLTKYIKNEINKQNKNTNINIINLLKNKKE